MIDPYVMPNGVLRNRLGITDEVALASAEADITVARVISLQTRPLIGHYDFDHLRLFHYFIFGDIFDWAGEIRTVDIAKQDAFCRYMHIESYAQEVFDKLSSMKLLRDLDRASFIEGLAEIFADINALHPFREGNGRTQRAFVQQLAADAGHRLTWSGLDPQANETASIAGFRGDLRPLKALFDQHVAR